MPCGEGGDEVFNRYGRYRSPFNKLDLLRPRPQGWCDGRAAAKAGAAQPGRTRLHQTGVL